MKNHSALGTVAVWTSLLLAPAGPSPAAAQAPVIDLRPAQAPLSDGFSRIRGVLELPDGRLLVADQTEKAMWRVDLDRGSRERIGGVGAGPDEFASPVGLYAFGRVQALVVDIGNNRLAVLDSAQRMTSTMPLFGGQRSIPDAADDAGRMYFDDATSLRVRKSEGRADGDRAWVLRWDERAKRLDSIAPLTIPGPPNPGPFPAWDRWAADRTGRVLVVRNQAEYRVDWYHPDGRRVSGAVVNEPRHRLGEAERLAWQKAHPRGGMSAVSMSRDGEAPPPPRPRPDVEFPDYLPYANDRDLWIDASGRGWVGRNLPAGESRATYDVFDASGRRIARVRLPEGREVVGFGARGLYAVRRDDVDLLWLERYDVTAVPGG